MLYASSVLQTIWSFFLSPLKQGLLFLVKHSRLTIIAVYLFWDSPNWCRVCVGQVLQKWLTPTLSALPVYTFGVNTQANVADKLSATVWGIFKTIFFIWKLFFSLWIFKEAYWIFGVDIVEGSAKPNLFWIPSLELILGVPFYYTLGEPSLWKVVFDMLLWCHGKQRWTFGKWVYLIRAPGMLSSIVASIVHLSSVQFEILFAKVRPLSSLMCLYLGVKDKVEMLYNVCILVVCLM